MIKNASEMELDDIKFLSSDNNDRIIKFFYHSKVDNSDIFVTEQCDVILLLFKKFIYFQIFL